MPRKPGRRRPREGSIVNGEEKGYVVVIQCDQVVNQVCSGFQCEQAFNARTGAFARYPADRKMRFISMSCGGCPGRATLRKLVNLRKNLKKRDGLDAAVVAVHLSSCITRCNHHGPRCPHVDYIVGQVERSGFDAAIEDSRLSPTAEKRRQNGCYTDSR